MKRNIDKRECQTTTSTNNNNWLGDTGVAVHITDELTDLMKSSEFKDKVVVGGKIQHTATRKGPVKIKIGENTIYLRDVLSVPNFGKRSISINKVLDNQNAKMIANKKRMTIKVNGKELVFENENDSVLRNLTSINKVKEVNFVKTKTIDITVSHEHVGHVNEQEVRDTLKLINIKVTGTMEQCDACMRGK